MNRFKLFKSSLDDFYLQLKKNDKGEYTYWWIPDLHCGNYCDIPEDCLGWAEYDEFKSSTSFIGYITFKEFDDVR